MKIFLTPQFLDDIKDTNDVRLIRRVFEQVFDKNGEFQKDGNDHRYHGIKNAWIRYVTGGKTAFRLIYILEDDRVFLYRTGPHSIEDGLTAPKDLLGIPVSVADVKEEEKGTGRVMGGVLLKTSQAVQLSKVLAGLFHVAHKEIWLVSPYISDSILNRHSPFGRFIDKALEEGTAIALVTKLSENLDFKFLEELEARGIFVYLHPKLHAKLYVFEIDVSSLTKYNKDLTPTAILGSANLTSMGLSLLDSSGNEELSYKLPVENFYEAKEHAIWLAKQSQDIQSIKLRLNRRF